LVVAFGNWLNTASEPAILLVLCLGLTASFMLGRYLRQGPSKTDPESEARFDQQGFIVSSVTGLLALLVGFTFALAIDRFDTRRERVLLEANSIGTTYLRAQLLEEPHRARISRMLVEYTDNRVVLAEARPGPRQRELLATSDRLLTDLWTATVAAFPSMRPYSVSVSFLETMNQMIDMDTSRKAARRAHVPPQVFLVLIGYLFITAGVLGSVFGGQRGRLAAAFLLFLFALTIMLVVDIDRPTAGTIREPQGPMIELRDALRASPPETYDRFNAELPVLTSPVAPPAMR
jgi:hypothetical protein